MPKKTKVDSWSASPEIISHISKVAEANNTTKSALLRDLVADFFDVSLETRKTLRKSAASRSVEVSELIDFLVDRFPLEDETVKPIVLKVPLQVMNDRSTLKSWLIQKVTALVDHIHPQ